MTYKPYIVCTQKNRLTYTIILNTNNIGFGWVIREILWRTDQFTPPYLVLCMYISLLHTIVIIRFSLFIPFPQIDAFWRLCSGPQWFQLYSIITLSFFGYVVYFDLDNFKVVCSRFVVCGKGLRPQLQPLDNSYITQ